VSRLIVLAGLPGSGKTTWAEQWCPDGGLVLSSDEIRRGESPDGTLSTFWDHPDAQLMNDRVFALYHEQAERALRNGVDVVADAVNLRRADREKLVVIGERCGALVDLVLFSHVEQAFARNEARAGEDGYVPSDVMLRNRARLYATLGTVSAGGVEAAVYESVVVIGSYT
jgi:predicted kinase